MRPNHKPVIEACRGRIVESIHYGSIAVVDATGQLLASYGDADTVTFMRSSAKPFQALPFVERGGDQFFGLEPAEIALMCASHSGTDEHLATLRSMQAKIGVGDQDLLCGTHLPYHEPTAQMLKARGEAPGRARNNCSGKHTGMLAHCKLRGLPTENYISLEHPVQKTILQTFAEMCDLQADQVELGIDGCSAPNFAVPLRNAARAYARLAGPTGLAAERAAACQRITAAMTSNPFMVSGPERFDLRIMEIGCGRLLAKAGAEGYQGLCLMPGTLGPGTPALGIAFKIADGDPSGRARPCVAVDLLRQLGAISRQEAEALAKFDRQPIYNLRHLTVGELRPVFTVEKHFPEKG